MHDVPAPPLPDANKSSWPKLTKKRWVPIELESLVRPGLQASSGYKPIDGATESEVGWMKVTYCRMMTEYHYEKKKKV